MRYKCFRKPGLVTFILLSVFSEAGAQSTTPAPPPEAAAGTWQVVRGSQRLQGTQYMKGSFANAPVHKWQAPLSTQNGGCEGEPVIGDVNGDEKNDVVVATQDGNLTAFDGITGTQLWQTPAVAGMMSPVIGDANGDGKTDVAIAADHLYLLDGMNGNIIWTFAPVVPNGGFIETCVNEGDLDNDGNVEVVLIVDDAVYAVNGLNGTQKWVYKTGHPVSATYNGSTPAIGDVNNDGYPDVVATLQNGTFARLVALDGRNGSLIWGRAVFGGFFGVLNPVPAIGDVDGDCKLDVVFNAAVLRGNNGTVIWGDPTNSYNSMWSIIADLNGDCAVEIVTQSSVLKGTDGSVIWQDSVSSYNGWFAPAPKVGDFNPSSPGKEIVLTGSYQVTKDSTGAYVPQQNPVPLKMLNGFTGALLWSYDIATLLLHTAEGISIGDIDNDGCVEIVVAPDCCFGVPTLLALDDNGNASQCGILASIGQVDFSRDSVSCNCFDFRDFSAGCANTWSWTFQGGTPAASTAKNPGQVCFPTGGSYFVSMSASLNTCPADTATRVIAIACTIAPPQSQFQSSSDSICGNDCIDFTDLSTGNPTGWHWSFPGALPASSSAQHPQGICYPDGGDFNAILVASNSGGSDTLTLSNFIHVTAAPPAPVISQSHDTLFCSFNVAYTSYQWYADTNLIPGATHPYLVISSSGNYNIRVSNSDGCFTATGINVILGTEQLTGGNSAFAIIPNPSDGKFIIRSPAMAGNSYILYVTTVLGEIIYQSDILNPATEIDLLHLASGIYFIRIENSKDRWMNKLLKQ